MGEFRMPLLGADMEAGTLVEWRIQPGARVKRGDIVAVVETQKGAIEVEIWEDGVVSQLLVSPGQKVPVGTVLALTGAEGARPEAARAAPAAAAAPPPPAPSAVSEAPPAAPRVEAPGPRRRVSPVARKRAQELGIDLAGVEGTGPNGAVSLEDVERAATKPVAKPAAQPTPPPREEERRVTPMAAIRQAIAAAMARSKREIPHYYLSTRIDMSAAMGWLEAENRRRPVEERLLPVALLLKAVALGLREVPELNGHFVDGAFRPGAPVHLGVAIALRHGGLIAPALHDADRMPLGVLMQGLSDLIRRARAGTLRSSELADATITVTSLGDVGAESVFGVIYPPQVAIVGFGRISEGPVAIRGQVAVRPVITATLSADHRVSDGHRGGIFLATVERLLQDPERL